ncbi:MAG: DUF2333 family protein [Desulfobacterales bacterium]|nr:DUF2333 family protein [Desulfobacterales bacterium]
MESRWIPKMTLFGKRLVLILLCFILIWPLTASVYWLVYKGYTMIDQTKFPELDPAIQSILRTPAEEISEPRKGVALSQAMRNRLEWEMASAFGWSVNDLIISPTRWLDNRNNRQRGTIFATRMLVNFFSTNLAKYGKVDAENSFLKEAREKHFAFSANSWWFPSTEKEYRKGLELLKQYEADVQKENAIYNLRSDDMYNLLMYIIGSQFLDQPLGLLVQADEEVAYRDLDDRIYYTQGVVLVLRDFLRMFAHLYPDINTKGGEDNVRVAFRDMDNICTFDPLIVLRGRHDSIMADHRGKMARYLISIRERINDVAQSIRR